ncbi:hypothetical protein A2U01_0094994, partial [Trifolium medium]|nr:hypothetical protein [Trifolium medium]
LSRKPKSGHSRPASKLLFAFRTFSLSERKRRSFCLRSGRSRWARNGSLSE